VGIIGNLENALKEFARSDKFKDKVKAQMKKSGSSISNVAKQSAEWYAERMQEIVAGYMDAYNLGSYSDMGIEIATNSDGNIEVGLSFTQTSNLSPSLNPDRDPVVLPRLLNTGFHTKSDIWGNWEGKYIHGLRDREAMEFLQDAVHEFNVLYGDEAKAEYIPQKAY
jgi:hypothetical protein